MPRRRPAQSTHGSPYALADHPSTSLKTAHHCPSRIDFPDRCKKEIGFETEASTARHAPAKGRTGIIWAEESGGWYRDRTCDPYHVKVRDDLFPDLSGDYRMWTALVNTLQKSDNRIT